MTHIQADSFRVDAWLIEPSLNRISRGGHSTTVRPRAMDLLVYFASRPSEVVSFDEIVENVWEGAAVSDSSVYVSINELRRALGDNKDAPTYIETIPRRGYRLIAKVRQAADAIWEPSVASADQRHEQLAIPTTKKPFPGHRRWVAALALGLLVVSGWLWTNRAPDNVEDKVSETVMVPRLQNSIAVLPFDNLSTDPDDAFFAAGIHEEILNQLSKIKDLSIIGRTSVMQYTDADKSVRQMAAELNVETIMEGSVRYDSGRVRITAQLIDGTTGAHLWSETYDRDIADIFSIQSDIALNITEAMKAQFPLEEQQAISRAPTSNVLAYEHFLRALGRPISIEKFGDRHRDLNAAISLDPGFARALGYKAFLHAWQTEGTGDFVALTPESQQRNLELARLYADRALAIDPDQADALMALSFVDESELQWAFADAKVERAYRSNPSIGYVVLVYGHNLTIQGRISEGIEIYQQSFSIDPYNWVGLWAAVKFEAQFGNLEVAAQFAERVIEMAPQLSYGYAELTLIEALRGERDRALAKAKEAESSMELVPSKYSTLVLMEAYRWMKRPEDVERLFETLQKIGETNALNDGDLFRAYLALGQSERALDHLDSAVEARFPVLGSEIVGQFGIARNYASLWGNPRFEAALRKMNLLGHYPRPVPPPVMFVDS